MRIDEVANHAGGGRFPGGRRPGEQQNGIRTHRAKSGDQPVFDFGEVPVVDAQQGLEAGNTGMRFGWRGGRGDGDHATRAAEIKGIFGGFEGPAIGGDFDALVVVVVEIEVESVICALADALRDAGLGTIAEGLGFEIAESPADAQRRRGQAVLVIVAVGEPVAEADGADGDGLPGSAEQRDGNEGLVLR
ncbi:MAG: hypothetical protein ABI165_20065 [Bryobacteraceae bacterium]